MLLNVLKWPIEIYKDKKENKVEKVDELTSLTRLTKLTSRDHQYQNRIRDQSYYRQLQLKERRQ